jgi:hypothetical protein
MAVSIEEPDAQSHGAATERAQTRLDRALARLSFDLYGLSDAWRGTRWVSGWGGPAGRLEQVELAHGDPLDPAATLVRVSTHALVVGRFGLNRSAADERGFVTSLCRQYLLDQANADNADLEGATWETREVSVDGAAVPLHFAHRDRHWLGIAPLESAVVAVFARAFRPEDLDLVTIQLEPYLTMHPILSPEGRA